MMLFFPNANSMAVERFDLNGRGAEQGFEEASSPFGAPTVTAFIGRTRRGPLNVPVPIESSGAFRRIFGETCEFSFLPQAVTHYFAHGGERAVIVRVANRATRAALDVPAGEEVLRLQAREPGSEERLRVSVDYDRVEREPERFNLVVQRLAPTANLVEDQEFFQTISIDATDERFIVDALKSSRLVRVSGPIPRQRPTATLPNHPGDAIPYIAMTAAGGDGEELTDYDVVGSKEEATGLFALDRIEGLDLLCIPAPAGRDLGHTTFLAAERYCERRRAMLIWDPSWSWRSPVSAMIGMRDSGLASPNALTYFPRLRGGGTERRFAGVPACGVVAGLLARGDRVLADPSRQATRLRRGFQPSVEITERDARLLNRHGINVFVRARRGGGYTFSGDVSLAGAHALARAWQNLGRRRRALLIVGRIERMVLAAGRAHDDAAWVSLQRLIKRFLVSLYTAGILAGRSSEQAFFTRPARVGFAQTSRFRFGFALEAPSEFLAFQIERARLGQGIEAVVPLDGVQLTG
jgi:Bacteriophage tail sheath protein